MPRTYKTEFGPQYALSEDMLDTLDKYGFSDESWGNNMCPSFEIDTSDADSNEHTCIRVWIDAARPDDREDPSLPRFAVCIYHEANLLTELATTDSFDVAVAAALAHDAIPIDEDEWGSERQVEAENRFGFFMEEALTGRNYDALSTYWLKANTEEATAYGCELIRRQEGDTT